MTPFELLLYVSPYVPLITGTGSGQGTVVYIGVTKDDLKGKSGPTPFCPAHRLRMVFKFLNDWKKSKEDNIL